MAGSVIVVFHHKSSLDWFEEISLHRCKTVFSSNHRVCLACPETMDCREHCKIFPDLDVVRFPDKWFESLIAYNQLKYSQGFYERFREFEWLLTYELDAFVFRDELDKWCGKEWSYIGAPWFENFYEAAEDAPFFAVGNSGFSLRRVTDCLGVLANEKKVHGLLEMLNQAWMGRAHPRTALRRLFRELSDPVIFTNAWTRLSVHEDIFWGTMVSRKFPEFRVADFDAASRFSFDGSPRRLFEMRGRELPFGCHKWHQMDASFWRPIIESFGYEFR